MQISLDLCNTYVYILFIYFSLKSSGFYIANPVFFFLVCFVFYIFSIILLPISLDPYVLGDT